MATTLGRKLRRWTKEEIWKLHRLHSEGVPRQMIAEQLNMPEDRVRQRLWWEAKSPESRIAKRNALRKASRTWDESLNSPRAFIEVCGPRPSDQALFLRDLRYAAPYRDLTGFFFGDPRVGFSALERRV